MMANGRRGRAYAHLGMGVLESKAEECAMEHVLMRSRAGVRASGKRR